MAEDFIRTPHNQDAEEAVNGSILLDGSLIKIVQIEPGDFYYEPNRLIFQAMLDLKEQGTVINQITLAQRLAEENHLEAIGGAAYLSHLIANCPTSLDCADYAAIVKRLSVCRQLIGAGETISKLGYESPEDTSASLASADSILLKLRQKAGGKMVITPADRGAMLFTRYTRIHDTGHSIGLSTNLVDLDKILGGGLFPGEVAILSARTSVGKSTMARYIANETAKTLNVLFASTEMNEGGLSDRDVASILKVPINKIRYGGFGFEVYCDIIGKAIPELAERKLYGMDNTWGGRLDTASIYQAGYSLACREGLSLVVIDHINKLGDTYGDNEDGRTGYIMRQLAQMAGSLEVPVLAVAHMNRASEGRDDKRPILSDLRNSGNIENDADCVMFLYRENYYDKTSTSKEVEIIVAKQRQGDIGVAKVLFDEETRTYKNLSGRTEETQQKEMI